MFTKWLKDKGKHYVQHMGATKKYKGWSFFICFSSSASEHVFTNKAYFRCPSHTCSYVVYIYSCITETAQLVWNWGLFELWEAVRPTFLKLKWQFGWRKALSGFSLGRLTNAKQPCFIALAVAVTHPRHSSNSQQKTCQGCLSCYILNYSSQRAALLS